MKDWIADDPDPVTARQLQSWLDDGKSDEIRKVFQGFLEFGTAGLRGRMGPGPSQMNRAVVARTAAGLVRYMKSKGLRSLIIGRDARHLSEEFARDSAEIFSGAGLEVFLLPRSLPTPVLAFALKDLALDLGVMVTASHNPPQDNGYKVYLGGVVDGIAYQGSQIIAPTDSEIFGEIKKIDSVKSLPRADHWKVLDESVIRRYVHTTARLMSKARDIKVVYTAMHGVGTETLRSVFHAAGLAEPILVDAQAKPDPDFPTVAFPNPEEKGAMDLALKTARDFDADIVIANDPDADRLAVAIKDPSWRVLRGDEVGAILGELIATRATEQKLNGVLANSIVSSSILEKIASENGLAFAETLTGFKWIAKVENLTFGYEEALGYSVDPASVNDKDGISAALLITDLAASLKESGSNLSHYLERIWSRYGFHATRQISLRLHDLSLTTRVLDHFRARDLKKIGKFDILEIDDLTRPQGNLPATEGVRLWLSLGGIKIRLIIRPSGTEPKLKCYLEAVAQRDLAESAIESLGEEVTHMIESLLR